MPEFEELRLQVSLIDNASAGLARLNQEIKNLGGGTNAANMEKFNRQTREMGEQGARAGVGLAGMMRGLIGVSSAIGTVGIAIAREWKGLQDFGKEMQQWASMSHATGTAAEQLRSMSNAMQQFGTSPEQATRTLQGLSGAMADLSRANSQIRQQLLRGFMDPQQRRDMEDFLKVLSNTRTIEDFGNTLKEAIDNVYREGIAKGLSPQRAAEAQRNFARVFGAEALIEMRGRFQAMDADEKRRMEERIRVGQEYLTLTTRISQNWSRIWEVWNAPAANSPLMRAIQWLDEKMQKIADNAGRLGEEQERQLAEKPFGEESAAGWWIRRRLRQLQGRGSEEPAQPKPQGSPRGLRFMGGDLFEGLPESENVEDRRGEAGKYLSENTAELKRLNDWLQGTTAGITGGGAGGALRFLGGGGGGISIRGLGGLPGMGAGTGGGPTGGGMPYGSDVGAGTGTGAGETPATGGAQRERGGGAASGGVPSLGGGAGGGAATWDKLTRGTPLEGQWSAVEQAARENGVPPNVMGGVMLHETGMGRNTRGNNVAGLMDPRTNWRTKQQFGSIGEGITAAGRTIGKNYARAGGDLNRMGQIYAPVGAANDPRGLNRNWAPGVRGFANQLGTAPSEGGTPAAGAAGTPAAPTSGDPTVPADILARARTAAFESGPGGVERFMASQGYPKSGAWCGQFAASVIRSAGGTPPRNAAIASNWRNYGEPVDTPQPGDVAIRRGTRTGSTGSHVTFVEGVDAGRGTFRGLGGNQIRGRASISNYPLSRFEFRRPTDLDRREVDTAMGREITSRVEGTGQIDVNVRAPRGTSVAAKGGGLFKRVAMNRQQQMEPAASGAPEPASMEE